MEDRKVRCVELDIVFDSVAEANAYLGYTRLIENVLNEHTANETAGGFHWEYVDEEIIEEVVEEVSCATIEEEVKQDVFVCVHCGKEYKTQRGLKKHIETKH